MRIQHNIMAMNSYRNYNNNVSALSANLEKLSSGYRINRAGDDAAGLAISEKMRAQITGLDAAQKNVKDGISLVKTAEGALQEVQDMMNRMVYLAEQSANGTYDNDVDRKALQEEVNALTAEIDRIAKSANFNGQKLLDGSLQEGETVTAEQVITGMAGGTAIDETVQLSTFAGWTDGDSVTIDGTTYTYADGADGTDGETFSDWATLQTASGLTLTETADTVDGATTDVTKNDKTQYANGDTVTIGGTSYTLGNADGEYADLDAIAAETGGTFTETATTTYSVGGTAGTYTDTDDDGTVNAGDTLVVGADTYTYKDDPAGDGSVAAGWVKGTDTTTTAVTSSTEYSYTYEAADSTTYTYESEAEGASLTLQIGDTSDSYNQLAVSINSMMSNKLFNGATIDISEQGNAQTAINVIKNAINTVSAQRGRLGAIQNRLEHTQNNLSVMEENITDAESTIRDTDVADEMMAYTKNNILIQSAQAMLAQANMVPQGVLQLLQ